MPGDFMGAKLMQACYYADAGRVGLWFHGGLYAEYDATNAIATRAAMRQLNANENMVIRAAMQYPNKAMWVS